MQWLEGFVVLVQPVSAGRFLWGGRGKEGAVSFEEIRREVILQMAIGNSNHSIYTSTVVHLSQMRMKEDKDQKKKINITGRRVISTLITKFQLLKIPHLFLKFRFFS